MCAAPRLTMQAAEWPVLAGLGVLWGWAIGVVLLGLRPTGTLLNALKDR